MPDEPPAVDPAVISHNASSTPLSACAAQYCLALLWCSLLPSNHHICRVSGQAQAEAEAKALAVERLQHIKAQIDLLTGKLTGAHPEGSGATTAGAQGDGAQGSPARFTGSADSTPVEVWLNTLKPGWLLLGQA